MVLQPDAGSDPAYRWAIVAISPVLLSLSAVSLVTLSVFLIPLTGEFGWSRAEVSLAYQIGTLSIGVGGIGMGWLADRYPVRRIVIAGAIVMGVCYAMLSRIQSLAGLYAYTCALNGLGAAALFTPVLANAGNWFTRGQGAALGIVTAGQSLGQGIAPYVAAKLIAAYGWRDAYFLLGAGVTALAVAAALLFRTAPSTVAGWAREGGPATDGGHYALPSWAVMAWLGSAAVFCCITMATPLVHLVALAEDQGIAPGRAALLPLSLFFTALFGRLLYGGLADRAGPILTYLAASAGQTVMVFGFPMVGSFAGLFVYSAIFALGYSGVMTSLLVSTRTLTPLHRRGLAVGVVTLFGWIGMGLGGVQGGVFYDLTGNYTLAFANAGLAGLVNLAILSGLWLTLRRRAARTLVPAAAD